MFIYFIEGVVEEENGIFCSLDRSSNDLDGQSWASLKLEARNFFQGSHLGTGAKA